MSVPTGLPAPRQNQTSSGFANAARDLAATDFVTAAGDYTGGTPEDEFNLTAHGLRTGDYVFLLWKSVQGVVTGRVGTKFRVKIVDANSFQITDLAGVVIENTADGTALFLKGSHATPDSMVQNVIVPRIIAAAGDFASAAILTDDEFTSGTTGLRGLEETDTLMLVHKAAAGVVTGISAGTTVFAKGTVINAFQVAATSGGVVIENSADGLAIFLKTA